MVAALKMSMEAIAQSGQEGNDALRAQVRALENQLAVSMSTRQGAASKVKTQSKTVAKMNAKVEEQEKELVELRREVMRSKASSVAGGAAAMDAAALQIEQLQAKIRALEEVAARRSAAGSSPGTKSRATTEDVV